MALAIDISAISDREGVAKAVAGRTDDEINAMLAGRCGLVVHRVSEGMKAYFVPRKAGKQNTVLQYDVRTPDGVMTFQMRVADGACDIHQDAPLQAGVKLNISLPDFLRLVAGKLSGLKAFMTGRLRVSGDVLLARKIESWFER
jgi:putative sterol carrier protein